LMKTSRTDLFLDRRSHKNNDYRRKGLLLPEYVLDKLWILIPTSSGNALQFQTANLFSYQVKALTVIGREKKKA
jgi:hypothetical protein